MKEKVKCEDCKASVGVPIYRYGAKELCPICMFFYLRERGYIDENDVKFVGNKGDKYIET